MISVMPHVHLYLHLCLTRHVTVAVVCFRVDAGPALPAEVVPETAGALQESHQGARHDVVMAEWGGPVCPHPPLPPRPHVGVRCQPVLCRPCCVFGQLYVFEPLKNVHILCTLS